MRDRKLDPQHRGRLSNERLIITEDTPPDSGSDYETDPAQKPDLPDPGSRKLTEQAQSSASSQRAVKLAVVGPLSTPPHSPTMHFSISTQRSSGTVRDPLKPPNTPLAAPQRASTTSNASMRTVLPIHDDLLPAPLRSASSSAMSNRRLNHHPHTPGPRHSDAEASFAAALVAGSLGYDFLYLLRFGPVDQGDSDEGSTRVEKFDAEVLVSHGMPNPEPYFDPSLHLRALRATRGLIYQNPMPVNAAEYEFGVLLPVTHFNTPSTISRKASTITENGKGVKADGNSIHSALHNDQDTLLKTKERDPIRPNNRDCRGGIILAGFMRKAPIDGEVSSDNIAEMRKLGKRLKELLLLDGA